ncbi:MAG: hypothetical protein P8P40_13690 [Sulfitobacter sp.]|nr:hypothetical protein [Sulfitobacter sp.]
MGKTPDNTSPHELYRAAVAFHDMTKLPVPHIKPFGEDQPAVYLGYYANLSFAVELYLKAFLKDKTGKDVSEFGHNLDKLLREAMEQGFSFEQENITRLVEILGPEHKGNSFRYAKLSSKFSYIHELDLVDRALSSCRDGMAHLH